MGFSRRMLSALCWKRHSGTANDGDEDWMFGEGDQRLERDHYEAKDLYGLHYESLI